MNAGTEHENMRRQAASRSMINRNFNQIQRRNISQTGRHDSFHGQTVNKLPVESNINSSSTSTTSSSSSASSSSASATTTTTSSSSTSLSQAKKVTSSSTTTTVSTPSSNASSNYECPYCTYHSQGNSADYLYHVKDHLCGKTFRCVLCNSVYKYRGDCVVHLKRKHQKADTIAHSYVDKFNLDSLEIGQICALLKPKQNEDFESEEKLFGCAYCDYKANYKGDVFKHQTRRHPGTVKSVTALNSTLNSTLNASNISENTSGTNSFNGASSGRNFNSSSQQQHHQQHSLHDKEAMNGHVEDYEDDELIINPEIYKSHPSGNGIFLDDEGENGKKFAFFLLYLKKEISLSF